MRFLLSKNGMHTRTDHFGIAIWFAAKGFTVTDNLFSFVKCIDIKLETYYALLTVSNQSLSCMSKSREEHDKLVEAAFWEAYGMSAKGRDYSMADFMNGKRHVAVTIGDM